MVLERRIAELEAMIVAQAGVIEALRAENDVLKARLGKDSANSSTPPSRDHVDRRVRRAKEREARKTARIDNDGGVARKPGKQPGSPGSTLQRRTADRQVIHQPVVCRGCGENLEIGRAHV